MTNRRDSRSPEDVLVDLSNWWFRLAALGFVTFLGGLVVFVNSLVTGGMTQWYAFLYMGVAVLGSLGVLVWLNKVRRNAPRRIQEFLWRMGLYRQGDEENQDTLSS